MNADPLLPIAPARVKILLLPIGKIKADRFTSFVDKVQGQDVVRLKDIEPDERANRNMFSPKAYPVGSMFYDFITHIPPPSHLALSPFDLYREPMALVALADGKELHGETFSKRHSANGTGPTIFEKNIRALYQELEDLRDDYPKALVHHVLIFDYVPAAGHNVPMPEGISAVPPDQEKQAGSLRKSMSDVSSLLLAEMTELARSFEGRTTIESPGHYAVARHANGPSWGDGNINPLARRNSQFSEQNGRSASAGQAPEAAQVRMSMPPVPSRPPLNQSNSSPARPATPPRSGLSGPSMNADCTTGPGSGPPTPERPQTRPDTVDGVRDRSRDRVSVHGFGPGGANDKWRLKGKGRVSVLIGSMYLMAGRWGDSLKELAEGATAARSLNDHIWHGKALELIVINLFLLGWSDLEFQVPPVCLPTQERPRSGSSGLKTDPSDMDPNQPKHLRNLQVLLPELLERISGLYSRISSESLPSLPLAETTIRFCKILSAVHMCDGKLNDKSLKIIVDGKWPSQCLTTSPRLSVVPSRQSIVNMLFKAFPSSATELLTTVDRVSVLCGIASVLSPLGLKRKKAMVIRELVSVLIGGLVEARTRGAAEAGVHPAAGLVSVAPGQGQSSGASVALDLGQGDIEQGVEAFLRLLCRSYGVVSFDKSTESSISHETDDSDEAVLARIQEQSSLRHFGFQEIKLNILRACINFSEALPDFNGVLKFSGDLLRTAGSGIVPSTKNENAAPVIEKEEQNRLVANISRTSELVKRLSLSHLEAEYWDEFLVRSIKLEPLSKAHAPIPHAKSVLPGAATERESQDVNPFIYNPFLKQPDEVAADKELVAGEMASFKITLQNTYEVEVDLESIKLDTEGVEFEAAPEATVIGPYRTQALRLKGRPKSRGTIRVTGAIVKVAGCRERRFPIFEQPWHPPPKDKVKGAGLVTLDDMTIAVKNPRLLPEITSLELNVITEQPLIVVKSTSLPQASVMILEGERQTFSVTLQNQSSTPVDFMLFSFKDSTQEALQSALNNREAQPAELYEYEWVLMKQQALRLPHGTQRRYIEAWGEASFDFEILGKAGLTSAAIQVDYTHLGVPMEEVTEQFYTRQVSVDITVTVNASIEIARVDAMLTSGELPSSFWNRLGMNKLPKPDTHCLLTLDLRNAWPREIAIRLEGEHGIVVDETILPGNTTRLILPVKRVFLEDPHAAIPSLNPSNKRQFVVSSSKITPETERANREAFWFRETMLDSIKATWATTSSPRRSGVIEMRKIHFSPRMIDAIRIDDVDIDVTVLDSDGEVQGDGSTAYVDEFVQVRVRLHNRTSKPVLPLVRLIPDPGHRHSASAAMDYTRRIAWNGTLQQLLPELGPHADADFTIGMTALARGDVEIRASVEEVKMWHDPRRSVVEEKKGHDGGRERSHTQSMLDASLGGRERKVWHMRRPKTVRVRDRSQKTIEQ